MTATPLPLRVEGLRHDLRPGETLLTLAALDLAPGTLLVLSGASGSGKSTLLYLLAGLLRPTAGRVAWAGTDIAPLSEAARDGWRRRNAGYVFQDFQLLAELSPLENVLLPSRFSRVAQAGPRARAGALLSRLGVPGRRSAGLLSRGEQQRVALARALLLDPGVIFADEPTASLDAESGGTVVAALRGLADEGRTVIAASHDPALAGVADRRLLLRRGQEAEAA